MDIIEAIRTRKSIRSFKPAPVSRQIIAEILELGGRAPSAMNNQPWEFAVLTGEVLEKVKQKNIDKLHSGEPVQPEHLVVGWPPESVYRTRQVELAIDLFALMDIPREDKLKRAQWLERGFRYFDAPAVIIVLADKVLGEGPPLVDIGTAIQTICLVALNYGLGTCIEDQGVLYPEVLREFLPIPENKRIVIAIAIGYPDWDFPANSLESKREDLDSITGWYGFD